MAAIPELQEKQGDFLVVVEANVHELIVQNAEEVEEEQQIEAEFNLITKDKPPKISISKLATSL